MAEQKRKWLDEVDIMRAIGIIAVLVIHATGSAAVIPKDASAYKILMGLNTFFAFAVPLFLFISAMILAFKYSKESSINWAKFYYNRLTQIIIPYLIWTITYLCYRYFYLKENFNFLITVGYSDDIRFVLKTLLFGKGFIHLYFISIIVQFYIVFPLILITFRYFSYLYKQLREKIKIQNSTIYLRLFEFITYFGIMLILQYAFIIFNKYNIYPFFKSTGVLLPSYILPIGIGIWLGYNLERWREYRPIVTAIGYPLVVLSGLLFINFTINVWNSGTPGGDIVALIRNIYVTFASLIIYDIVLLTKDKLNKKLKLTMADLGACSFGIYLLHLLILKTLHKMDFLKTAGSNMYLFGLNIFLSFIITLLLSWAAVKLINKTPLAPVLFGNRQIKKK